MRHKTLRGLGYDSHIAHDVSLLFCKRMSGVYPSHEKKKGGQLTALILAKTPIRFSLCEAGRENVMPSTRQAAADTGYTCRG